MTKKISSSCVPIPNMDLTFDLEGLWEGAGSMNQLTFHLIGSPVHVKPAFYRFKAFPWPKCRVQPQAFLGNRASSHCFRTTQPRKPCGFSS